MRVRPLLLTVLIAGALVAPATGALAQDGRSGIVIRLLEAPEARRDDPRARAYIVDHVQPGTSFTRAVEVTNDTDEPVSLQLYDAAAEIRDGRFTVSDGRAENRLTPWVTITPASADLAPDESMRAEVAFEVPDNAPNGEFYAGAMAERPPPEGGDVRIATRVGIRIYLSVGTGAEPVSDFRVESLTGERRPDGRPVVRAAVVNTGGRALDLVGQLTLRDGPGGATAGPFAADVATTLAPGGRAPVAVLLEPALPAGPWLAVLTATSGLLQRAAQATLTFPEPGQVGTPVPAEPVAAPRTPGPELRPAGPDVLVQREGDPEPRDGTADAEDGASRWLLLLALLLLVLLLALLLVLLWRRRKKDDEQDAGESRPPPRP